MKKLINILLPFIATLFLWRLSFPILNPNGILAFIPIFYYSLIDTRKGFLPMALLGCFLMDYNFDLTLFWTAIFCALYAFAGLQSRINLASQKFHGWVFFMIFIGLGLFIQGVSAMFEIWSLLPIFQAALLFVSGSAMYIPLTYLFRKVNYDKKR